MAFEGSIVAGVVSGFLIAFPKHIAEIVKWPFLMIEEELHEKGCYKKPKTEPDPEPETQIKHKQMERPAPSFKQMGPVTMVRVASDENYINVEWRESEVAEKAMKLVHENLHDKNSYEKIANTCAKLIELYAMKSSRKSEFIGIRDRLMKVNPTLAEKIEIDKFSQCAWYEGRIMLYR